MFVCFLVRFILFYFFARRPAMLALMGFSGSLPLYVIHRYYRYYIFVFIDRANKDACLLVVGMKRAISLRPIVQFCPT